MFELHPQLANDCLCLGRFPLSELLLLKDANYPWFILVPARAGIREIHHLEEPDQLQLLHESVLLGRTMERVFAPDKLNVAALGNMVPQLHLHHVARYQDDPAWPAPVWGRVPAKPYDEQDLADTARRLIEALPADCGFVPAEG